MSDEQRDIMAGLIDAAMDEWEAANLGAVAAHIAGHIADRLMAAGFGLAEQPRRIRRAARRVLPPVEDQEPYKYPPDPYWGKDTRGRWQYVDYDGESLVVRFETDGDMWLDKEGQGPVYVRKEHIPVIIAALNGVAE